jgi:hypothetical protein
MPPHYQPPSPERLAELEAAYMERRRLGVTRKAPATLASAARLDWNLQTVEGTVWGERYARWVLPTHAPHGRHV